MKKWLSVVSRSLRLQGVAVGVVVILMVCLIRRSEVFSNHAELPVYDLTTELSWPWKAGHPDLVLVTIQDPSIGWPLSDATLATALERLISAKPSVIGIDLIRDRYLDGPDSEGAARLAAAGMDERVVWAEIEATGSEPGFPAPPFIAGLDDEGLKARKLASATFPVDSDRNLMVRRGKVASWAGDAPRFSLAALLAWKHRENASAEAAGSIPEKLLGVIGTLPPTAGGYWFDHSDEENTSSGEFLLKPVKDAAARFRLISIHDPDAESVRLSPSEIPVFSLAEIVSSGTSVDQLQRIFEGKLVLLGTHDQRTAKDEIAVPGDPLLRGVKLHALATSQLLRELEGEAPVRFLPDGIEDLIVVLACLLALLVIVLPKIPLVGKGVGVVVLLPIIIFVAGLACLRAGIWLPTASPMIAGSVTGIAGLVLLWRQGSRERREYLAVMNSHLGPEVAARVLARNQIMTAGMAGPPETIEASALFGDLRGYSAASQYFQENHTPEAFFAWLNGFLGPAADITGRHGGFIKQFLGDGIYVIFGFPPKVPGDHAQRAVSCARELADLIPTLNRNLPEGIPKYYVRIGIYTGEIHASSVGSKRQSDFSFLGPTINKASRLESIDKELFDTKRHPVRVLISENTNAYLDDSVPVNPYRDGPILLDKRLPPERVWELVLEEISQEP